MKLFLFLCLASFCLAVSSVLPPDNVLRFKPQRDNTEQALMIFRKWILDHNRRVSSFEWSDCGNSSSTLKVNGLTVSPDPVKLPGIITVGFDIDIAEDFNDGLSGKVELFKKVESTWIKIPCIGVLGSCTYDDVCGLMSQIAQCPQPFIDNKIPCKCPFKKGSYKMPASKIDIGAAIVPPGDYKATVVLDHTKAFAGCLNISLSIQ